MTLLLLSACGTKDAPIEPPQRIVLVTIDTLRADHLGTYGYPRNVSPFLDSLAERGVLFTDVHSSMSHTAPSHATMFTGLQPQQHRVLINGQELAPSIVSLAEVMKAQGYSTAAFAAVRFLEGVSQGFDEFRAVGHGDPMPNILQQGREWLDGRRPDEKAFLWLHIYDVHEWAQDDHLSAEDYAWIQSEEATWNYRWKFLQEEHGLRDQERKVTEKRKLRLRWKPQMMMEWHDRYDSQIRWVDRELGKFFDEQTERSPEISSLWIVTSDHGEGLGNHGTRTHGSEIYLEQLNVPLIFYFSDETVARGVRLEQPVRLVDLGPTIADLVGGSLDDQVLPVVGRSLVPLMRGAEDWKDVPIFAQRRPPDDKRLDLGWMQGDVFALQSGNQRIMIRSVLDEPEFYDLSSDPHELVDLFAERPEDAERLRAAAQRHFDELTQQIEGLSDSEIGEEFREELEALGYL